MLFYMRVNPEKYELVLVDDDTDERTLIDTDYFLSDGHCSYSPDGKWLLYDSYPDTSTPDSLRGKAAIRPAVFRENQKRSRSTRAGLDFKASATPSAPFEAARH